MGSIRSSIELQDNFTNVLMNVVSAVRMSVSTMEQMQSAMNGSIDTSAIQGIRDQINQATIATQQLVAAMRNMSAPQIQQTSTPNWVNQSTIQVSTNTGIQRLTDEMSSLNQMSGEVFRGQQRIDNQALNMNILPRNASWDINDISQRVTALSQHLQNLQGYDVNLLGNDGAEQISRQYETIRTNMNGIINLQAQLDRAIQEGDVSGLNQGYNQLNQMIVQVEQQARNTQQVLNSLTNIGWHSPGVEVFTGNGTARFQQEVQSANNMLNTLNNTQVSIATRAAQVNIFPPNMMADINNMQNRLQAIQTRIQAIESNPVNMGTDTANAELEQLRSQLYQAVQEQESMNRAVQNMDIQAANQSYLRLQQVIGGTERHIRDNVDEQGRFNNAVQEGTDSAAGLKSIIANVVDGFDGMAVLDKAKSWIEDCTAAFNTQLSTNTQLITALTNILDKDYVAQFEVDAGADTTVAVNEINDIQNRIDEIAVPVTAEEKALTTAYNEITAKASEIQGRGIYSDEVMIAGATEFTTYFSDIDAITMMMDTLSNYAVGMSGGGALDSSAMIGYATELGEIMSGSYEAITNKGFEFTDAQKAIFEGEASRQQIVSTLGEEYLEMSSDMQAAAVISQVIGEKWGGLYEIISNTPEGKIIQMNNNWRNMKEVVGGQLYPYVLLFVDAITENWGTIQVVIDAITLGLQYMLGFFSWLVEGAIGFAQVIIDNWSWISPIIYAIIGALALYCGYLAITKGLVLASAAAEGVMAVWKGIHAAAIFITTSATWAQVTAQNGLNAAMYACPIVWIIVLIIALVAIIFAVCSAIAKMTGIANSGFGVIAGGINVVIQFFKNLGLIVVNIALGIGNAIGALASNMMTAFHNAICSVQSWFYDLLFTGLSVIEGICKALNKLPFVEFDYSGVTSAADNYAAKAAEAARNKEDYKSISDAFNNGFNTFDTFQEGWVSDAFNAGASWGDGIAEKIANFDPSLLFGTTDIPSADDYAGALTAGEIGSGVDDISGNTGAMADAMDITKEELKYLRDIAEQEIINRFTTAEINIEQTNHNTIGGKMDLDGIVSGLTDVMYEAVDISAEGVHI